MKYNALGNTGIKVSHICMGGAAFSNIYGEYNEDRCFDLLREVLKRGVNYFETGPWYGQGSSERTFGKGLVGVPRESYYIASKVGRYELNIEKMFDFSAEKTEAAVDSTLERLGLDYVDLIQIHDFSFAPDTSIIFKETLPALEKAVRDGKARFIGLADYDLELMKEVIEESDVKISTILSYAKSTLHDNRLQNYTKYFKRKEGHQCHDLFPRRQAVKHGAVLRKWKNVHVCEDESKGVGVINAAATGMGLLSNQGPQPWHPASEDIKTTCQQAAEYCKSQKVELARLATWFTLNQPDIDTNMCGFFNMEQLRDTFDVLENGLTEHEKQVLADVQLKYFNKGALHWDNVESAIYRSKIKSLSGEHQ